MECYTICVPDFILVMLMRCIENLYSVNRISNLVVILGDYMEDYKADWCNRLKQLNCTRNNYSNAWRIILVVTSLCPEIFHTCPTADYTSEFHIKRNQQLQISTQFFVTASNWGFLILKIGKTPSPIKINIQKFVK